MRWLSLTRLLLGLWCALLAASCQPAGVQSEPAHIRLVGSETGHPLLGQLMTAYAARHSQVTFEYNRFSSRASLNLLRTGRCDMVLSAWPPSASELNPDREAQIPLKAHLFATEGLILIVNSRNPVDELSSTQLRSIFSGRVADWREVGGKVGDILVISREDGSDDRRAFETLVMDGQPVTLGAVVMPGSADVAEYVAGHPNAIGYAALYSMSPEVKAIAIDGVRPTYESVLDSSYPLWRHLALLTRDPAERPVQDFLTFVLSEAGQRIVDEYYRSQFSSDI